MYNALTIDVEDYYMVSAFADVIRFEDWPSHESRVERNTRRVLALLDEYGVKATFFVLGWVAERYPELVRGIHAEGHEVACHGYNHRLIYELTPEQFREDTHTAKGILEDITGTPVRGYRATSYSVVKDTLWALDILIEEGFLYDSSIFPIHHDRYGFPEAERFCARMKRNGSGDLLEIPPSTIRIFGKNLPIAGGGYLRLFPAGLVEWGIRSINEKEGQPAVVYVHPWELDPEQPKLNGRRISVFRHYINLDKTIFKLRRLLGAFRFAPMHEVFAAKLACPLPSL